MKKELILEFFNYELYDELNKNHILFFNNLWEDEETQKYLYNKEEFISNILNGTNKYDCIYLVKLHDVIIGFVSIYFSDNTYEICDGVLPNYRGKGYATKLIKEFSTFIFSNTNTNTLYGYIDKANISSIKTALNNGFKQTGDKEYILEKH